MGMTIRDKLKGVSVPILRAAYDEAQLKGNHNMMRRVEGELHIRTLDAIARAGEPLPPKHDDVMCRSCRRSFRSMKSFERHFGRCGNGP